MDPGGDVGVGAGVGSDRGADTGVGRSVGLGVGLGVGFGVGLGVGLAVGSGVGVGLIVIVPAAIVSENRSRLSAAMVTAWDPTGNSIYFRSNRGGEWVIWKIPSR